MKITTNRAEVEREVAALAGGFSLKREGRHKSLGEDMADAIAQGEIDRTVNGRLDAEGAPLKPLSPRYLAEKVRAGYPETILVRTGQMLSQEELVGNLTVGDESMEMDYGKTEGARQKAVWAQEGSKKRNRPERTFIGLDDRIEADLDALAEEGLDRQAERMGAD